jgi:hypothetical protein
MKLETLTVIAILFLSSTWGFAADATAPAPTPAAAAATAAATFEASGLRIVKPVPGGDDHLRGFNYSPGTSLGILVTAAQGGIIAIDGDASQVASVTDDKGKDLTKPDIKSEFGDDKAEFGMMPEISADGKRCQMEVNAPGVPTKGATALSVTGTVVLQMATQKKDFTADKVVFKPGAQIKAGDIAFTVESVDKPEGDDSDFSVTLAAKQSLDSVAEIQFFDAAGKKIESARNSSMRSGFGDSVSVTWKYGLKTKVAPAKLVVSSWTDLKKVTLPVNLTVGVGL